jgi:hypothetical protein
LKTARAGATLDNMARIRPGGIDEAKLDRIVAQARKDADARNRGYREQALKLYPWVCGRCGRDFHRGNLRELTVHHRNHDHDFNPPDGSNWELLCVYCHDNEHARHADHTGVAAIDAEETVAPATGTPFAGLQRILGAKKG